MRTRNADELGKACLSLICGALLIALLASASHAGPIDLVKDFPASQGQGGFAAYGFNGFAANPHNGDGFRLLTTYGPCMFGTPEAGQGQLPLVERVGMPDLTVLMYPCCSGTTWGPEWATLTYTAASRGDYSFSGAFKDANSGKATTRVYLFKNADWAHPFFADVIQPGHLTAAFNVMSVSLKAGDKVSFAVDANGDDYYDFTQLSGTITSMVSAAGADTPEPTTFAALAMGLMGTWATVRRRR